MKEITEWTYWGYIFEEKGTLKTNKKTWLQKFILSQNSVKNKEKNKHTIVMLVKSVYKTKIWKCSKSKKNA